MTTTTPPPSSPSPQPSPSSPLVSFTTRVVHQQHTPHPSPGNLCFGLESADPAGATYASTIQAWAKLVKAGVALLLINPDTKPHTFRVPSYKLPLAGGGANISASEVQVRDLWALLRRNHHVTTM